MSDTLTLSAVPLICPLDGLRLSAKNRSLICERNHCFDVAADGHINLLPVQFKASRDPGDSKSMVQSRRRVMSTGLFQPVAEAVGKIVRTQLDGISNVQQPLIVDVGCGEGYFTAHFSEYLNATESGANPIVFGLDVSKWAVSAAAARYKNIAWAVASGRALPIESGSPTMITTLFGFQFWKHWSTVQKVGGLVAIVDAGPEHLIELRQIIYPELRVRDAPTHSEAAASNFGLICSERVTYDRQVEASLLPDILEMTPHGHKTSAEARSSVSEVSNLQLTIDTVIRVFRLTD